MKVWPGGAACFTNSADLITRLNTLPDLHHNAAHVNIYAGKTVTMVKHYRFARIEHVGMY